jgi:hypothetical protein
LRIGPFRLPWGDKHAKDPYWERFIKTPPADMANLVTQMIRESTEGNVFPAKAELHTPDITSRHIKELAVYLGADHVGVARLNDDPEGHPFAVVCAVQADYAPRVSPGIGGQVPVLNGMFVSFVLSAYIRELGFRATAAQEDPEELRERLAAAAGLGTVNAQGRLSTPKLGTRVHVVNLVRTDLPLAPDGEH